ncbi:MAG: hypothetical protein ACXABD_22795, partial [Candidatus Thorarchaeota archaeon]
MRHLLLALVGALLLAWPVSVNSHGPPSYGNTGGAAAPVLVRTVGDLETEAATAASKSIAIPSGTFFSTLNHGGGVCTGGSAAGGGGGVGEFEAADATFASAVQGDYVLVTAETDSVTPGPYDGEFCKIASVASAAGTTTLTCDRALS